MQCPSCGLAIPSELTAVCPACGRWLSRGAESGTQPAESAPLAQQPPMGAAEAAPAAPSAAAWPSATGGAATPHVGTPQEGAGYPRPGYGQPVPAPYASGMPPGYPPPGTPPGYPAGYPWAAPVTTPMPPWGAAPGWYAPAAPPPPERKRRTGLLVGSIIGVVLIVCVSTAALLYVVATHAPAPTAGTGVSNAATQAAATAAATGEIVYQNSFATQYAGWVDDGTRCFWAESSYHIANSSLCFAPAGEQSAVDISVQVKQISGPTTHAYGIVLRGTPQVGTDYYFSIDSNSQWIFYKCVTHNCTVLVHYTSSPAIQGGLNTPNFLEVRAIGSHFDFFVNGVHVGQADDSTLSTGYVGLDAGPDIECVFTNLTISRLD